MRRRQLVIGRSATLQIRLLDSWWRENRTAARTAVTDEIQRTLRLLRDRPFIGPAASDIDLPNVRRIHISRISHYLYYRIIPVPPAIEILAIWSDSRGEGLPL